MKPKAEAKKTSEATRVLHRMVGDSLELRRLTQEARVNAAVAQLIYDARTTAGLSHVELGERIDTKPMRRFLTPEKVVRGRCSNAAILEPAE